LVLRIPQDFIGQQAFCSVFLPLNHDHGHYDKLRQQIQKNSITVFDVPEFGTEQF
jgi:hypothetical protein